MKIPTEASISQTNDKQIKHFNNASKEQHNRLNHQTTGHIPLAQPILNKVKQIADTRTPLSAISPQGHEFLRNRPVNVRLPGFIDECPALSLHQVNLEHTNINENRQRVSEIHNGNSIQACFALPGVVPELSFLSPALAYENQETIQASQQETTLDAPLITELSVENLQSLSDGDEIQLTKTNKVTVGLFGNSSKGLANTPLPALINSAIISAIALPTALITASAGGSISSEGSSQIAVSKINPDTFNVHTSDQINTSKNGLAQIKTVSWLMWAASVASDIKHLFVPKQSPEELAALKEQPSYWKNFTLGASVSHSNNLEESYDIKTQVIDTSDNKTKLEKITLNAQYNGHSILNSDNDIQSQSIRLKAMKETKRSVGFQFFHFLKTENSRNQKSSNQCLIKPTGDLVHTQRKQEKHLQQSSSNQKINESRHVSVLTEHISATSVAQPIIQKSASTTLEWGQQYRVPLKADATSHTRLNNDIAFLGQYPMFMEVTGSAANIANLEPSMRPKHCLVSLQFQFDAQYLTKALHEVQDLKTTDVKAYKHSIEAITNSFLKNKSLSNQDSPLLHKAMFRGTFKSPQDLHKAIAMTEIISQFDELHEASKKGAEEFKSSFVKLLKGSKGKMLAQVLTNLVASTLQHPVSLETLTHPPMTLKMAVNSS